MMDNRSQQQWKSSFMGCDVMLKCNNVDILFIYLLIQKDNVDKTQNKKWDNDLLVY